MNLRAEIERLEKQLSLLEPDDSINEWERAFSGWTEEELFTYATTGIKPEGKTIGQVSDYAWKATKERFDGWTEEELLHYAMTGEKPEESRL